MNWILLTALLVLPLSVSANTLLECHPHEGSFAIQDIVIGNVVLTADEVILFQLTPVFETVSFKKNEIHQESSSSGAWRTYVEEKWMEEMITLELEDSGKVRRGRLTRESVAFADEPFYEVISLKCFEK